jgi:O-antigen ligase
MAKTGYNVFKNYPLFGVGANNIKKVYNEYKPKGAPLNEHLHNNFIQTLAERGIFTLLALILVFISIIINLIKKIKNGENFQKVLAIGVLFTFFAFLVAGMFEYNFGHSQIKFILFYFLSLPFIRTIKDNINNSLEEKSK